MAMQGSPGWPRARRQASTSIGQTYSSGLLRGDAAGLLAALAADDRGDAAAGTDGSDGADVSHVGIYVGAEAIADYLHEFAERWDDLLVEADGTEREAADGVTISGMMVGRLKGSSEVLRAWFRHRVSLSRGRPVALRVAVGVVRSGSRRPLSSRALMAELVLEIVEGPGAGRRVSLAQPVIIGRAPDAGLVLDDDQVSRHHARVAPGPGGVAVVEDLGSTNGSFINRAQLHGPAQLRPGDDLLVGVTVVELREAAEVARRPSAVRPIPPALAAAPEPPRYLEPLPAPEDAAPRELERLMDTRTKLQARTAPLAVLVLVALVVAVYLGSR